MDIFVTILSIIGAILIIGIIIMVHELGHYSIGRACKIKIVEFAVGFGPKIKSWVKNGIKYSVRWLPIGGFTKFYGEDEESDEKLAFNNQPAGRRALTIAAGPIYNILFAFLLVVITLCAFGDYVPTVGKVWAGSPAEAAGLQDGDVILEMNGVDMDFIMEVDASKRASNGVSMPITVRRGDEELSFNVPYEANLTDPEGTLQTNKNIGIYIGQQRVSFTIPEAFGLSFKWMYLLVRETILAVFGLFSGHTENAGSIVIIVSYLGQAIRSSVENVLRLGVAISASLAIMNLLPLPALDGGRLVFIGIEKIFRKPVPRNVEGVIHFVGFAALMLLFVFLVFNDIRTLVGG